MIFLVALLTANAGDQVKYKVSTDKSVEQAVEDFKINAKAKGFGTLHVHDISGTLKKKNMPINDNVKVLEICNPKYAYQVLSEDLDMNMGLPCRVSVYTQNGKTVIGMVRPTVVLSAMSDSAKLAKLAKEVEDIIIDIMNETK